MFRVLKYENYLHMRNYMHKLLFYFNTFPQIMKPIRPKLTTQADRLLLTLHFYHRYNHFFQTYAAMLKRISVIIHVVIVVIGIT